MPLDFSNIPKAPDGLIDALKTNRAIAIVGSGLSIAAGGPSWKELLLGVAAEATELAPTKTLEIADSIDAIDKTRFLDSANILNDILTSNFKRSVINQITHTREIVLDKEAIKKTLDRERDQKLFKVISDRQIRNLLPTISHRMLMQLGFRAIITTNYDLLLEAAMLPREKIIVCSNSDPRIPHLIQSGTPFILKIHGDIEYPDDIIITREEYARLINTNPLRDALRSLFLNTYPFWIGYGHNDPDLDLIVDNLLMQFGISGGTALVCEDERLTINRLRRTNIFPSEIPSYDEVSTYLNRLATDINRQFELPTPLEFMLKDDANMNELHQKLEEEFPEKFSELYNEIRLLTRKSGTDKLLYIAGSAMVLRELKRSRAKKREQESDLEKSKEVSEELEIPKTGFEIEFVNRDDEIREVTRILSAPYFIISAPMGYGKTRLIDKLKSQLKDNYLCIHVELRRQKSYSIQSLASKILQKLGGLSFQSSELTDLSLLGGQVGLYIFDAVAPTDKRKVLLFIDEVESVEDQVAKLLIDKFIPAIQEVLSDSQPAITLRVILSGRYISDWKQFSYNIPFQNMDLTPFDLDAIHQTVINFNSQSSRKRGDDYVKQFASNMMYFTGGHPGCMANILRSNDFGMPIRNVIAKEDTYFNKFVHPCIGSIERDIPRDLKDIFETLSAVRRFNTGLLQWFVDTNLIRWSKPVHDLEDQLLRTYLVHNDEGFLKDEITRRLFAIRFHRNRRDEFIHICEESISFYDSKLAQSDCYRPDIVSIEILFQVLQVFLCQRRSNVKPFIEKLKDILNRLNTFTASRDIITTVEQRLTQDWEFNFNFNYLYPKYSFERFVRELSTLKQKLTGG